MAKLDGEDDDDDKDYNTGKMHCTRWCITDFVRIDYTHIYNNIYEG